MSKLPTIKGRELVKFLESMGFGVTRTKGSHTRLRAKTGTVTLFAFDEGEGLSEHTAPFEALVYLLDGEAEVTISGTSSYLRTGDMILMPANEPHALKALKRFKMLLTMIKS